MPQALESQFAPPSAPPDLNLDSSADYADLRRWRNRKPIVFNLRKSAQSADNNSGPWSTGSHRRDAHPGGVAVQGGGDVVADGGVVHLVHAGEGRFALAEDHRGHSAGFHHDLA